MIKVAVTGNIGSGKSTVCRIFESLGINVYYADIEAKKFYDDRNVIDSIKALFGRRVFDENDKLLSKTLAGIVFQDPNKLAELNKIIHPRVLDDFMKWAESNKDKKYIVYESALLFESGFHTYFDKSILVRSPKDLALDRVMARDKITESEFQARASNQQDEDSKTPKADLIINNDESLPLIPQIIEIHRELIIL